MEETDARNLSPSVSSDTSEEETKAPQDHRRSGLFEKGKSTILEVKVDFSALSVQSSARNLTRLKSLDDSESDVSPSKVSQRLTENDSDEPDASPAKPKNLFKLKSAEKVPRGHTSRNLLLQETPIENIKEEEYYTDRNPIHI